MMPDGEQDPSTTAGTSVLEGLESFFQSNGVGFGSCDLLLLGSGPTHTRLRQIVNSLLGFRDIEARSPFASLIAIIPPTIISKVDIQSVEAKLRELIKVSGRSRPANSADGDWFRLIVAPDLRSISISSIIAELLPNSAVIICDAALYRDESVRSVRDVTVSSVPSLEEDFWAPQVYAMCQSLLGGAKDRNLFIILDIGQYTPNRTENRELLCSIDNVGVLGGEMTNDINAILADQLSEWDKLLLDGRLGAVFSGIRSLPFATDADRAFLRIQMLHRAGLNAQALGEIETFPVGDNPTPIALVKLARIASDAGATILAQRFLSPSIESLDTVEGLGLALDIAYAIADQDLEQLIASRLEKLFPGALDLTRRKLRVLEFDGDFGALSDALAENENASEAREMFAHLAKLLPTAGIPDYISVRRELHSRFPVFAPRNTLILIRDAVRRRLPIHALEMALPVDVSETESADVVGLILNIVEQLALDRDELGRLRVEINRLQSAIAEVIRYLALHSEDAAVRARLAHVLFFDVSGPSGLALIATSALVFFRRPLSLLGASDREAPLDENLAHRLLASARAWLQGDSEFLLGRRTFPKELLTDPADDMIPAISKMIRYQAARLSDDDDVNALSLLLSLGVSIAPHSTLRNQDIQMIREVACALAIAGRVQHARDLAEQILQQGSDSAQRRRASWFAVADIYHRLGNNLESLIAFACAAAGDTDVEAEEAWHEANGLVRLLRDIGLFDVAREVHEKAWEMLERMGLTELNEHRHRFMSFQIDLAEASQSTDEFKARLPELLASGTVCAEEELLLSDGPDPVAVTLGQLIHRARVAGIDIPESTTIAFSELLERTSTPVTQLVQALSSDQLTAEAVLSVHRNIENARYADDVGYDGRHSAIAAHQLLAGVGSSNPVVCSFSIELLADRAVSAPGWQTTAKPLPLIESVDEPANIAKAISKQGLSIVLTGIDSNARLVWTSCSRGELGPVVAETPDVFSVGQFRTWADEFPLRYGIDETTPNLFYVTTERLGLSSLPDGMVIIAADTELQQFPCNLLRIGDDFAGQTRAMASVPSLSWFQAARTGNTMTNGRSVAWISKEEKQGQTLAMVAERLADTLDEHGIELDTGAKLPIGLAGSELVIVTAHGGIGPDGKFFQRVSDEGDLMVTGAELANALRNVGVVILFVCSGGRSDKHPGAITTVGLAKKLLDRGCSAVLASPWPLDSRVTYHWLPTFLAAWKDGVPLAEANHQANLAVAEGLGYDPAKYLAMAVFGDALRSFRGPAKTTT